MHRVLLCYKNPARCTKLSVAAAAIVQLDQTEFRTSYAERERVSVTGSPLPQRLQGGFLADCSAIRPRLAAISRPNSFSVFFPKALGGRLSSYSLRQVSTIFRACVNGKKNILGLGPIDGENSDP
jgi:hypothetical protein